MDGALVGEALLLIFSKFNLFVLKHVLTLYFSSKFKANLFFSISKSNNKTCAFYSHGTDAFAKIHSFLKQCFFTLE